VFAVRKRTRPLEFIRVEWPIIVIRADLRCAAALGKAAFQTPAVPIAGSAAESSG